MKKFKLFFLVLCTFISLNFDIYNLYLGEFKNLFKLGFLASTLLIYLLFKFYKNKKVNHNKSICILSMLLAFFMIFGYSFMKVDSCLLIFKNIGFLGISVIMYLGYFYLFNVIIGYIFKFLDTFKFNKNNTNKFITKFKKHPFLFSLIFIIICWLPYIISFYPIILSPDPSFQIKQFFGIRTKYADYSVLLDENVVMTNHHPVTHTILLGSCLKLGTLIGNDNLGLFIYSLIQIIILSTVLAFTIYYMNKMKINHKYLIITLFIYALVPMFPLYAMSGVKDVLFGAFIILYIICIHNLISTEGKNYKWWNYLLIIMLLILICLFRNNGIHVIILSFPFLLFVVKKKWKELLLVFFVVISFNSFFNNILLPYFKITPGSIREMLSVPFQQTARYVKYHSEDLSKEDIKIINYVLGYDDIAERYDPELADPVKNAYNKYTTNEELLKYFNVWFKGLLKHPGTYIEATMNNVYGFFYPEKTNWYVYYKFDDRITEDGFNYHYNSLKTMRNILSGFAVEFPYIPIIGFISNIAFNVWIIFTLLAYTFYKKNYKKILILLPTLVLILVCVVGPANTYFRYALPFIFAMPFIISNFLEKKDDN